MDFWNRLCFNVGNRKGEANMVDHEILLAISNIMDEKLKTRSDSMDEK